MKQPDCEACAHSYVLDWVLGEVLYVGEDLLGEAFWGKFGDQGLESEQDGLAVQESRRFEHWQHLWDQIFLGPALAVLLDDL